MKAGLAAAIKRDILDRKSPQKQFPSCFACGRTFTTGIGRFCSDRCRAAFDAGLPAFQPPDRFYSLPKGPRGFLVDCAHCRRRFDSPGWRCCSTDCERNFCRKQKLDAELADDAFRVVKRKCLGCDRDIPNWRNGRRVSKATRFCSPRCAKKPRKPSGDQTAGFGVETVKKTPFHAGSGAVENSGPWRVVAGPAPDCAGCGRQIAMHPRRSLDGSLRCGGCAAGEVALAATEGWIDCPATLDAEGGAS